MPISKRSSIPAPFGGGGSDQGKVENPLSRLYLVYLGHVFVHQISRDLQLQSSSAWKEYDEAVGGFRDASALWLAKQPASGLAQARGARALWLNCSMCLITGLGNTGT